MSLSICLARLTDQPQGSSGLISASSSWPSRAFVGIQRRILHANITACLDSIRRTLKPAEGLDKANSRHNCEWTERWRGRGPPLSAACWSSGGRMAGRQAGIKSSSRLWLAGSTSRPFPCRRGGHQHGADSWRRVCVVVRLV